MTTKQIDKFIGRKVKVVFTDEQSCVALLFRARGNSRLTGKLYDEQASEYEIGMLYCSEIKSISEV